MFPREPLKDVWNRMSQKKNIFKWLLQKKLKFMQKRQFLKLLYKLLYRCGEFQFQTLLRNRGAKIGAQKVDIKIGFMDQTFFKTHKISNYYWGIKKRNIGPLFYPLRYSGVTGYVSRSFATNQFMIFYIKQSEIEDDIRMKLRN